MKKISLLAIMSLLVLVGCSQNKENTSLSSQDSSTSEKESLISKLDSSENQKDSLSSSEESQKKEFSIVAPENSYSNEEGVLTILTSAETYILSGEYKGNIVIPESVTKVTLSFNDFTLTSLTNKAIYYTSEESKLVIDLQKDTVNKIISKNKTAIDSENNIEIQGNGSLEIESAKNGISCSNFTSEVDSPNVTILSGTNGIQAKKILMSNGNYAIKNVTYGLYAEKNSKNAKGDITLNSNVQCTIQDSENAIYAETSLSIMENAIVTLKNISSSIISLETYELASTASLTLDGTPYTK